MKYHSVGTELEELALADPRVVFIGSDLGAGQFERLRRQEPERFFMEGISEQHLIGMAAGMAREGLIPYVMTIATFLTRRCLEQILVDVALHSLPVRLLGNGSGLAYAALGPTHTAVEDFALLRAVPGMTVVAPAETVEANNLLRQSVGYPGPLYMRLPRGAEEPLPELAASEIGRAVVLREPGPVLLVGTGQLTAVALEARELLAAHGIGAGVLHAHTVHPLDRATLAASAADADLVVTVEEHRRAGGLGSAVLEALHDAGPGPVPAVLRYGLGDSFVSGYGTREEQLDRHGLTAGAISAAVEGVMRSRGPGAPGVPPGPAGSARTQDRAARSRG
jgi:transketolase